MFPKYKSNFTFTQKFDKENECIICLSNPATVILTVCLHKPFCQVCANEIISSKKIQLCPLSRTEFDL